MKVGIQPTEGGAFFDETLAEVRLAERLGVDSVWLSEHHGVRDHYWPSPLLALAALAVRTERILLGTNVLVLPFYHPRRVAEEGAMLHLLSKGRFVLGVGMGYRAEEYEAFGLRPASKGTRYERGLRELTSLLSPEHAAGDGDALPVEPWARPPVWAGGWGPENLRRAATSADAWIPGPTADMGKLLECREIYHRHLREAGRDPREREAPLTRELIVAPTEREAWDAAEAYLLPMYRDEYGSAWGHGLVDPERARELGEIGRNRFIIGSPDQVIAQTRRVAGEFGCTHIIYRLYGPRTPHAFILQEIELLGREVAPALREG
jgi:alkanesulfonate monooxygenase SsuD/methylene tetrahydromethanopterin reductase-like flavin-dependent oxidoreductase (luciferase family)